MVNLHMACINGSGKKTGDELAGFRLSRTSKELDAGGDCPGTGSLGRLFARLGRNVSLECYLEERKKN